MDSPGQTRPSVYRPTQLLDKFDHMVYQFTVVTFKVKVLCVALVLQPSHKTAKSKILTQLSSDLMKKLQPWLSHFDNLFVELAITRRRTTLIGSPSKPAWNRP